jgi:hypothetical protein
MSVQQGFGVWITAAPLNFWGTHWDSHTTKWPYMKRQKWSSNYLVLFNFVNSSWPFSHVKWLQETTLQSTLLSLALLGGGGLIWLDGHWEKQLVQVYWFPTCGIICCNSFDYNNDNKSFFFGHTWRTFWCRTSASLQQVLKFKIAELNGHFFQFKWLR